MSKFIISTDSSADIYIDNLKKHNIYCILMKRIVNGKEIGEIFNSEKEFENFYEEIKNGALPKTSQLNSYELEAYFNDILTAEKNGDIIHIALSSGLSGTYENAKAAAVEINKKLTDRKIYVIDSLIATGGIEMLTDKLLTLRDNETETAEAVKQIEAIRDRQQAWIIVTDLFHLKRGGRISGVKAALGTLLGVRPILIISKDGRLSIESTIKGSKKAIRYVINKIDELGIKARPDFFDNTIYLIRTSKSEIYNEFKQSIIDAYPQAKIKETIVGPIVGTHLGDGCAVVLFEGAKRLDDI